MVEYLRGDLFEEVHEGGGRGGGGGGGDVRSLIQGLLLALSLVSLRERGRGAERGRERRHWSRKGGC